LDIRLAPSIRASGFLLLVILAGVGVASSEEKTRDDSPAPPSDQGKEQGWKLCQELSGYARLRERFQIDQAILGYINGFDLSLFVRLHSTGSVGLNAAWWWNPVSDGTPRSSWTDFLECFDQANEVVKRHSWLQDWLESGPGRSLELHAFGCATGSRDFDLNYFVRPLWRDAILAGEPLYEVLARRANSSWARIFLNSTEPRALIAYTMEPDAKSAHWLDRLEVSFHPRCQTEEKNARYFTVLPSGELEPRRFSACKP